MEKIVGGAEQVAEREQSRERDQALGGAVLDVMEAEAGEAYREQGEQAKFREAVEKINQTSVIVYERLNPSNMTVAREGFLADTTMRRPNFEFGNIQPDKVAADLATLKDVEDDIAEMELDEKQKLVLEIAVADNQRRNNILKAANDYNEAASDAARIEARQEFAKANAELYGVPDEATFEAILADKFGSIKRENLSENEQKLYDDLKLKLSIGEEKGPKIFEPQPETVQKFGEMMEMLYDNLFQHIPQNQETFTGEEVSKILREIIDDEFDGRTAYTVEYMPDGMQMSVDEMAKVIQVPGKRAAGDYTREDLRSQVIGHELGTHAYRSMVYEESPFAMFHEGAPGSSDFDEGLAVCVEQALKGKYQRNRGAFHYINIGLATFRGMDFRDVFETQKTLQILLKAKVGETEEETQARYAKAEQEAFRTTARCFRGTGELPNNKDLIYFNGSNQVWKYIEERIDDPEGLLRDLFLSGKTNQLDSSQQRLVYEAHVGGLE